MKCKICGANLKKEGDICKNCYNEFKEYEKLAANDEKELLQIKRKYSFGFIFCKSFEFILLLFFCVGSSLMYYNELISILILILCIALTVAWFIFAKKRADGTTITLYETKIKYNAKYFWVNREEIIPYTEIEDIAPFTTFSQKIFGVGDVRFYTKGFLSGLTVSDIPNIKENYPKIGKIVSMSYDEELDENLQDEKNDENSQDE